MVTFQELNDLRLGKLQAAVTDWQAMIDKLVKVADGGGGAVSAADMDRKAKAADWKGQNATVTKDFVTVTAREFGDGRGLPPVVGEGGRPRPPPALPSHTSQPGTTGSNSGRWPSEAVAAATRSAGTSPYSVVRGRDGRPARSAMAFRSWIERYEP